MVEHGASVKSFHCHVKALYFNCDLNDATLQDKHVVGLLLLLEEDLALVISLLLEVEHDLMEDVDVQVLEIGDLLHVSVHEHLDVVVIGKYLLFHLFDESRMLEGYELEVARGKLG